MSGLRRSGLLVKHPRASGPTDPSEAVFHQSKALMTSRSRLFAGPPAPKARDVFGPDFWTRGSRSERTRARKPLV
ncbi:hypothetical protein HSRCO_1073 [Halanaeroarchaeum sp. HSR-CO]|nr:hypothetical protein HSRCO_1073 [Halanaeroarchaeum sp. HSR-CO]